MPAEPCKINCGQCQRGNPIGLEPALDFDAIYLRRRAELTKAVGEFVREYLRQGNNHRWRLITAEEMRQFLESNKADISLKSGKEVGDLGCDEAMPLKRIARLVYENTNTSLDMAEISERVSGCGQTKNPEDVMKSADI